MKVAGLGPKRIHTLHEQLGIVTIGDLKRATLEGRISALRGFGKKTEQLIIDELGNQERDLNGSSSMLRKRLPFPSSITSR